MGALTNKSFPFELRGWEIEKIKSLNPTDSFADEISVLVNNQKIIQIEPYSNQKNSFINNKTRQFFDALNNKFNKNKSLITHEYLKKINKSLFKTIYLYEICNLKYQFTNFFVILFENLDLQTLSLFSFYQQKYKFLKVNKFANKQPNDDFEFNFKLNNLKLNKSNSCLLIATNIYKQTTSLNLKFKQRYLKGNFKLFSISSLLNITFINKILGNTISVLKLVVEGTNLICQDLKNNAIIIFNSELLKRKDNKQIFSLFSYFQFLKNYSNISSLNCSIYETGVFAIGGFKTFNINNLLQFSSIYFVNLNNLNSKFVNKILDTKLTYFVGKNKKMFIKKNILNQYDLSNSNEFTEYNKKFYNYFNLPTTNFFETKQILFNNEGLLKHTNKIIFNKKNKSNWKLVRTIFNQLKKKLVNKNNLISFNNNASFINFLFLATTSLNKNNYITKNNSFFSNSLFLIIKKRIKLNNTKINFWLNDFFVDGKDNFSKNSIVMLKCSKSLRFNKTNLF